MSDTPLLDKADPNLTTLNFAVELQKLAAQVGFDWPDVTSVIAKIQEELAEVNAEIGIKDNHTRQHEELGDLLFACTNLARHLNIDPEQALNEANKKFYRRFSALEQHLHNQHLTVDTQDPETLELLWQQVKTQESKIT